MRRKAFSTLILLFLTLVLLGQQAKQIQFREESFNFGQVVEDGGPVVHEFVFTNNASRPVKILAVKPSCGCTTPSWTKELIQPGKNGFIQASFDPKGRPGYFNKSLTVTTDLEANPIILQIKGQVSSNVKPNETDYQIVKGGLRFKGSSFNMGKVFIKDEYAVKQFPFYNASEDEISFTGKTVAPPYIKAEVEPMTIKPGEKGIVRVSYNGKIKNMYGFQSDNVELYTTDEKSPVKSFSVYATLEEYFPQLSPEEFAKAPQLSLSMTNLDLGKVSGQTSHEVTFTNNGKKELQLRSLQGNCTCVSASAGKMNLKPGETSNIKITFDPLERSGTQQKAITIYSNDPRNPVQRITLSAYVD